MSPEDYSNLLATQGGMCAICDRRKLIANRTMPVDHDHTTGAVRGILCNRCNCHVGWFETFRKQILRHLGEVES